MRFKIFVAITLVLSLQGCQRQSKPTVEKNNTKVDVAQSEPSPEGVNANKDADQQDVNQQDLSQLEADVEHDDQHPGMGRGFRGGRGPGAMGGMRGDMTTIHAMFAANDNIKRTVTPLPDGAEAITESDDEEVASLIQTHVPAMEDRVLGNEPLPPMTFHPIFVALIKNSDKYTLDYEETDKGIKVRYTADDPFMVMLVQEHAKLVSRFLKYGMAEIHKPYELPELQAEAEARNPTAKRRAIAAKEVLFKRLSGRLTEVMQAKGPAAAIEVCSQEASRIAQTVGDEHGVTIGRTSLKLRNSSNQPPAWVKPLVAETPLTEPKFVSLPNGHTGALLPIMLQAKCVTCHGTNEIPAEVKSKLAELYPDDQATGFATGDLRGWFWVDVPPTAESETNTVKATN